MSKFIRYRKDGSVVRTVLVRRVFCRPTRDSIKAFIEVTGGDTTYTIESDLTIKELSEQLIGEPLFSIGARDE